MNPDVLDGVPALRSLDHPQGVDPPGARRDRPGCDVSPDVGCNAPPGVDACDCQRAAAAGRVPRVAGVGSHHGDGSRTAPLRRDPGGDARRPSGCRGRSADARRGCASRRGRRRQQPRGGSRLRRVCGRRAGDAGPVSASTDATSSGWRVKGSRCATRSGRGCSRNVRRGCACGVRSDCSEAATAACRWRSALVIRRSSSPPLPTPGRRTGGAPWCFTRWRTSRATTALRRRSPLRRVRCTGSTRRHGGLRGACAWSGSWRATIASSRPRAAHASTRTTCSRSPTPSAAIARRRWPSAWRARVSSRGACSRRSMPLATAACRTGLCDSPAR